MLEVMKFIVQKSSNVRNNSMLEISENILNSKLLMISKMPQYRFSFLQNTLVSVF